MNEPLICNTYYRRADGQIVKCDRPAKYYTDHRTMLTGACGIHARPNDLPIQPTNQKAKATT